MLRRKPLSLKARALQALAQREYSRAELRAKLQRAAARAQGSGRPQEDDPAPDHAAVAASPADLEALLDDLEGQGLLSDARFTESRIHVRRQRFGNLRIEQELRRHGLQLDEQAAADLRRTEVDRARAVWARKFDHPPQGAAELARQMRFLAGRGFSAETIRKVLQEPEP